AAQIRENGLLITIKGSSVHYYKYTAFKAAAERVGEKRTKERNDALMESPYFFAIDFDGTVTDADIIDTVLQRFADPAWQEVETQWERGLIGSRQCLETQMSLVDSSLAGLLDYIDEFAIDESFRDFIALLAERQIPYAIISDGFRVFIERLLATAGLKRLPVYANELREENTGLKTLFPYSRPDCDAANCKCDVVARLSGERPVILIGDGRSDFCIARKANHVFTKNTLTGHCRANSIPHTPFDSFSEITAFLKAQSRTRPPLLQSVAGGKD
ncbi:MAG TPA: MtnX-like HAD-IB family phosphatase, partial [Nitrospirota bacterium]